MIKLLRNRYGDCVVYLIIINDEIEVYEAMHDANARYNELRECDPEDRLVKLEGQAFEIHTGDGYFIRRVNYLTRKVYERT